MNDLRNKREVARERVGNALALLLLILIGMLAFMGPSGLLAWSDNAAKLEAHEERIAALEEERAELANRVELLDPDNVDPDLSSELVRRDLGVAHQDEVVVDLGEQH
ncbi:FtsB family cell division protein [Erythrobacter alti]|uniref:FtsB family cell division protein n=1 Tax=Erythrobacter alti TaxID=1896145 RepID=UPI0030F48E80